MMFPLKTQKRISSARTIRLWYHANCEQKILFLKMGEPRPDAPWNWLTPMPCDMLHRFYLTQDNDPEKFGVTAGSDAVCMWQLQGWMISEWKKQQHWWKEKSTGRLCRCKQHDFLQWFPLNQRLTRLCNGPKLFWMTPAAVIGSQVCSDQTSLVDLVV